MMKRRKLLESDIRAMQPADVDRDAGDEHVQAAVSQAFWLIWSRQECSMCSHGDTLTRDILHNQAAL